MKKLFKQATVSVITAAILGSIIPMKSHAEEITNPTSENTINQVNTQTSLPVPPILQGRAVNVKYPQMPIPTVEAFSNDDGTGTGYLDVSWEPVDGVTKYQVILFNGSIHSYWDVPADQTTWTKKNKGMFPTEEQIEAGQVNFKRDGSGTEFSFDPSTLYKKAFEVNGGSFNYSTGIDYYVRVTAVYNDGASPISFAATGEIPPPELNDVLNTLSDSELNEILGKLKSSFDKDLETNNYLFSTKKAEELGLPKENILNLDYYFKNYYTSDEINEFNNFLNSHEGPFTKEELYHDERSRVFPSH
ncbi:hypothetical protein V7146_21860 [Gottfriedia acidiceleris]|uniref:hypothetical protein n=1 Tax=Gottfriedia acidiceleris TaxID=371036 RepID=UPI0030004760